MAKNTHATLRHLLYKRQLTVGKLKDRSPRAQSFINLSIHSSNPPSPFPRSPIRSRSASKVKYDPGGHIKSAPPQSQLLIFGMDYLPVELWFKVFGLACTDGGRTGCSIALVSKAFHDVSEPTRFQSVALSSVKQVDSFCTTFEAQLEKSTRCTIRNLFIRFHLIVGAPPGHDHKQISNRIRRIVSLASVHLHTLVLRLPVKLRLEPLDFQLPVLNSLTYDGNPHFLFFPSQNTEHPVFPSLHVFELICTHYSVNAVPDNGVLERCPAMMPSLADLWLRGVRATSTITPSLVHVLDLDLTSPLAEFMTDPDTDADGYLPKSLPVTFDGLRVLCVSPIRSPKGPEHANVFGCMMKALNCIAEASTISSGSPDSKLYNTKVVIKQPAPLFSLDQGADMEPNSASEDGEWWP